MRALRRAVMLMAGLALLSPLASAYYYFVYFANRTGPFTPVPVKFDLNDPAGAYGIAGNRVTYLISNQGPGPLVAGDTFQAFISQIRAAAEVWNGVATSGVRLAFGGTATMPTADATPEVDIEFDDNLTPGLLALSRPTTVANPGALIGAGATFLPIVRSKMQLRKDFTNTAVPGFPMASYSDLFFITVVHEFGHTLGLQHTWTSSVMSTLVTSAATKSAPLGPDDIAGISMLYPANGYPAGTGSITGTVLLGGGGVNLASVVAIATNGVAISGLTNPDGTYRIDGLPPGQYYVYVHPLPQPQPGESQPGGVYLPLDGNQNAFAANTGFGSEFFGATTDWTQAPQVSVTPGNVSSGVSFNVRARSGPAVSSMTTYGYLDANTVPVGEPPLQSGTNTTVVFKANGILGSDNASVAPGLNVSVLGGPAQVLPGGPNYFQNGYLYMYVYAGPVTTRTPTALAVTLNGDLYVLPSAFTVVTSGPPSISSVSGSTDGQGNSVVNIAGTNLGPGTRIVFDGAPASLVQTNSDGSLTVAAPPGSGGYRASVEALTPDSQTSAQTLVGGPPTFTYGGPMAPGISVSPSSVTPNTDTMIQITGYNTNFVDGQVVVGFGSSDITVKHVWVVSPGLMMMNVSVSPTATAGTTTISVVNGLQMPTLTAAFQIGAPVAGQSSLRTPILNQTTGLEGVPVGGTAVISTSGLPNNLSGWTLSISNQLTPFTVGNNGQLIAIVPGSALTGPSVVQLASPNGNFIPPVVMQVDLPPPVITAASNPVTGAAAAAVSNSVFHAGDPVSLLVTGLSDQFGNLPAAGSVDINIGGVDVTASSVAAAAGGTALVQFQIPGNVPTGNDPMTIRVQTRVSAAFSITIQ
ncbi:MAG TPA: matrixin family metalloprotease [Bryobacteraceae bacterium]|nr:matrixin family metalloprotease [Bryobacteraceae bacterium]